MIGLVQRVSSASVTVEGKVVGEIGPGLLVLVGIEEADHDEDIDWLTTKIINLRIFNDADGVMNVSLRDSGGDLLVVSQFTLHASTKKGNRPSYIKAAKPDVAVPLYNRFLERSVTVLGKKVARGIFGADMKVALVNDGPVTIIIDTKNRV
jgi:D-aminoacyl-tRNA deacylase